MNQKSVDRAGESFTPLYSKEPLVRKAETEVATFLHPQIRPLVAGPDPGHVFCLSLRTQVNHDYRSLFHIG